ncbi:hypothetical protein GA0061070_103311 [Kosakonia oryziphila]|uniref:Uncharacterized protein n=1 Tax=Kosakonia oryziphila TaxID=1005667 RepID=A0A1C4F894_9ENTR|nr:hypothetical protein GA0061070_103311 [Kosakonia oryziphila]
MVVTIILTSTSFPQGYSPCSSFFNGCYKHSLQAKALQISEKMFKRLISNEFKTTNREHPAKKIRCIGNTYF